MLEQAIQSKIIVALEKGGWLVNKIINCTKPGWPDLECFKAGRCVFIEVKRPGQVPEHLQLYRHQKLRQQGFEVIVAYSLTEIRHLL